MYIIFDLIFVFGKHKFMLDAKLKKIKFQRKIKIGMYLNFKGLLNHAISGRQAKLTEKNYKMWLSHLVQAFEI